MSEEVRNKIIIIKRFDDHKMIVPLENIFYIEEISGNKSCIHLLDTQIFVDKGLNWFRSKFLLDPDFPGECNEVGPSRS